MMSSKFGSKGYMPVISYGIACCRKNTNNQYELLMIKKKSTYAFSEFVIGSFDIYQKQTIKYMLDDMSIDEKISILSLDYSTVWFKLHSTFPPTTKTNFYNKGLKKFAALVKIENGKYITNLINTSSNSELLWEIPKGRSNRNESPIDTAVREFKEETNIFKEEYKIVFNEDKITYSFSDNGIIYVYIYFIAIMLSNRNTPKFAYESQFMFKEVTDIKFLTSEKIKAFNNNRLYKLARIIITKAKKYIK